MGANHDARLRSLKAATAAVALCVVGTGSLLLGVVIGDVAAPPAPAGTFAGSDQAPVASAGGGQRAAAPRDRAAAPSTPPVTTRDDLAGSVTQPAAEVAITPVNRFPGDPSGGARTRTPRAHRPGSQGKPGRRPGAAGRHVGGGHPRPPATPPPHPRAGGPGAGGPGAGGPGAGGPGAGGPAAGNGPAGP